MAFKKKYNSTRPLSVRISFFTIVGLFATGFVLSLLISYVIFSPASSHEVVKIIDVPSGSTTRNISSLLYNNELITNRVFFESLVIVTMKATRLQAGEYELNSRMNMWTVLSILANGRGLKHRITIPEGFTIAHIASLLEENGLADKERFLELATDRSFLNNIGLDKDSAEGYLFPDTYLVVRKNSQEEILIELMYKRFQQIVGPLAQEIEESGFNTHEIVILAALIEKETGHPPERELISAVFRNRLKRGMRLETDPTILYAIGDINKTRILTKDKLYDSPYNTYLYRGLPPGPIANPGFDSIVAAIRPTTSDYLYFVSRNNGTHHFSTTYNEHFQAVTKYQKLGVVGE